jgi:hypothetical protein
MDFALRTFLGSRMHVELGDVRRLPVPVLNAEQVTHLEALGRRAVTAKKAADRGEPRDALHEVEAELDAYTRDLYGIRSDAELWVVR